jgi:hypothetical protein
MVPGNDGITQTTDDIDTSGEGYERGKDTGPKGATAEASER